MCPMTISPDMTSRGRVPRCSGFRTGPRLGSPPTVRRPGSYADHRDAERDQDRYAFGNRLGSGGTRPWPTSMALATRAGLATARAIGLRGRISNDRHRRCRGPKFQGLAGRVGRNVSGGDKSRWTSTIATILLLIVDKDNTIYTCILPKQTHNRPSIWCNSIPRRFVRQGPAVVAGTLAARNRANNLRPIV